MLHSSPDAAPIGHGGIQALTDGAQDVWFPTPPRTGVPSAWYGHVPFAFWLVDALRPRVVVELGTHNGVSYAAFCEAVAGLALDAKCYAVDTWQGDEHAGFYPEQIYADFQAFHDARYSGFSRLLRTNFDEAANDFADGSVDLLHIDGCHAYDMVRHDFETWRPRLSSRAVVLFHDTNVRERDFGVWRLWAELTRDHPGFEFVHSHGLGVLAFGPELEGPALDLCRLSDPAAIATIRTRFAMTGHRCMAESDKAMLEAALDDARRRVEIVEAGRQASEREWIEAQAELSAKARAAWDDADVLRSQTEAARVQIEAAQIQTEAARLDNLRLREALAQSAARMTATDADLAATRSALEASRAAGNAHEVEIAQLGATAQAHAVVMNSTLWRALGPLRSGLGALPAPARRSMRGLGRAAWWTVTPWRMPARLRQRRPPS